jgi:DEAD/DEAH box helicase domain-containing protein
VRDTAIAADKLDRRIAVVYLSQLLQSLTLPASLKVFGPGVEQWMCARPLQQALDEALEIPGTKNLVLHLTGTPAEWDLGRWWAAGVIDRHSRRGVETVIAVPRIILRTLGFDVLLALNSLVQRGAPNLRVVESPREPAPTSLMAVVGTASGTKAWAAIGHGTPVGAVPPELIVTTSGLSWIQPGGSFDVASALSRIRPALSRIQVNGELDGRIADFGVKFWKLLQERSVDAQEWLAVGAITKVEYEDRYLFNPLSIALLAAVLRSIPGRVGKAEMRPTAVVRTIEDHPGNGRQSQPYAISHDWIGPDIRDYVLKEVIANAGFVVLLETASRQALPHGRSLRIHHSEGAILDILLDQGFGYWRSRSGNFDFAAPPSDQARSVAQGHVTVVGSMAYPTTLILDMSR